MQHPYPRNTRGSWLAAALLASGCQLSVEEGLVKPAPDAACPEGLACTPVEDAGEADANDLIPDDAGQDPDTGEPASVACSEDSVCGTEGFCSKSGSCTARCDAITGCVVANTGRLVVTSMLTTGDAVLYATETSRDSANNWRHDGAIWRLHASGTSTKLVAGLDRAYLQAVADDQIYFTTSYATTDTQPPPALQRAPLAGGDAFAVLVNRAPAVFLAVSPGYLWWGVNSSVTDAVSSFELWRRPRGANGIDTKLKDIAGHRLVAATDGGALYARWEKADANYNVMSDLLFDDLSGGQAKLLSHTDFYWFDADVADERIVGTTRVGSATPRFFSAPLQPGAETLALVPSPPTHLSQWSSSAQFVKPWLYWSQAYSDKADVSRRRYGRTHAALAFEPEILAELPGQPADIFAVAPWGDELLYYDYEEQRLYRLPIKPTPCSATVACPEGRTCQPNNTCH
jgi:hypothetical protein